MQAVPAVDPKPPKTLPSRPVPTTDILEAENDHRHSSIGRMVQSINQSAPMWVFGSANREDSNKLFLSKRLLKGQVIQRDPNTPLYHPSIDVRFQTQPKWGMSQGGRSAVTKPVYPHYELVDRYSNPLDAFKALSRTTQTTRFKSADRVSLPVPAAASVQPRH